MLKYVSPHCVRLIRHELPLLSNTSNEEIRTLFHTLLLQHNVFTVLA